MLALQKPLKDTPRVTPNLLPCRVAFNGPVNASARYWEPETKVDEEGKTAYFRGRKLKSRTVQVQDGYYGVLVKTTDKLVTSSSTDPEHKEDSKQAGSDEDEGDDEEQEEPTKIMEEVAQFDEMQIWGHETMPAEDDIYVRGMEEWIGFAEAMHSYDLVEPGKMSG